MANCLTLSQCLDMCEDQLVSILGRHTVLVPVLMYGSVSRTPHRSCFCVCTGSSLCLTSDGQHNIKVATWDLFGVGDVYRYRYLYSYSYLYIVIHSYLYL